MFREMRRIKQALSEGECVKILKEEKRGVLAVSGDGGYPYAVPMNFRYDEEENAIYFHSAQKGHKIDAIRKNDKVSFCVIAKDDVISEKRTTAYISVIAFGRAEIIEDEDRLREAADNIGKKFSGEYPDDCKAEIDETINKGNLCCVEIKVEHLSGKCGLEVLKERNSDGKQR